MGFSDRLRLLSVRKRNTFTVLRKCTAPTGVHDRKAVTPLSDISSPQLTVCVRGPPKSRRNVIKRTTTKATLFLFAPSNEKCRHDKRQTGEPYTTQSSLVISHVVSPNRGQEEVEDLALVPQLCGHPSKTYKMIYEFVSRQLAYGRT